MADLNGAINAARHRVSTAQLGSTLERFVAHRRNRDEQIEEQVVKDGQVHGFVEVDGSGETLVDVFFPVTFLEKPVFTFGHELNDNNWPVDGSFPMASATVLSWKKQELSGDRVYYVGAQLGIVILGPDQLQSVLHYIFAGQTFTNPSITDPSIGGTL